LVAVFDGDGEAGSVGVEGVFEEFLDDGGGAFDDLAGGDFVNEGVGEDLDFLAHEGIIIRDSMEYT
jgi:hypothetical protein